MAIMYTKPMSESKLTVVSDNLGYGIYVWVTDDRKVVQDQFGNYMNIPGPPNDARSKELLRQAAIHYGIEGGRAVFIEGSKRISDDQYQEQLGRMLEGDIPDPDDPGSLKDALKRA